MRGGVSLFTHDIRTNYTAQYPFPPLPPTPTWGQGPSEIRWYKKLRHYWHSTMANALKDGEDNFSGSIAWGLSCFPKGKRMRKLWLSRRRLAKIRVTLAGLCRAETAGWRESRRLSSPCCSLLPPRPLLLRLELGELAWFSSSFWKLGVSAYSTLPTSRLLHYYFLGSRETEAN